MTSKTIKRKNTRKQIANKTKKAIKSILLFPIFLIAFTTDNYTGAGATTLYLMCVIIATIAILNFIKKHPVNVDET